jgi:hypothetical protein
VGVSVTTTSVRCMTFRSPGPPWYAAQCKKLHGHDWEHDFGTQEEAEAEFYKGLERNRPSPVVYTPIVRPRYEFLRVEVPVDAEEMQLMTKLNALGAEGWRPWAGPFTRSNFDVFVVHLFREVE